MNAAANLQLRGLRKAFGPVRAVDGVDLEVPSRSICALLGPSGCGKTTTLRLIAGLERADGGEVLVGGKTLAGPGVDVPASRRGIGIVFQDYALFPHLDVAGNVGYALGRRPDPRRVAEVLDLVGLAAAGPRPVHELSGGQQQRVALARALAPTPQLVLLDEPFSNLDAALRDRLRLEVRGILVDAGVTALFVTHDQAEALSIADQVAVMHEGIVEQSGPPEDVYARPVSRRVAASLGDLEVLPGLAAGGQVGCELGIIQAPNGEVGEVELLLRPEAIAVAAAGQDGVSARVLGHRFFGHDHLIELRLASGRTLRSRQLGYTPWRAGDEVSVRIAGPVDVVLPTRA